MHAYNQFIYSRERRRFGRQCLFSDRTQLILSINPSQKMRLSYILRNPIDRSTQLSDQFALSLMETENVTFSEHGIYHYEGGWPKEVNINDEEQTLRHRKKVEREDNWGVQVTHLVDHSMTVASQNSAINIYQEFFSDQAPHEIRTPFEARQMNIFHDPVTPPRSISILNWAPTTIRRFLAQHTNFDSVPTDVRKSDTNININTPNGFYIWDMKNPLKPVTILETEEVTRKACFCPKDENFIAGGSLTGKVCLWDTRTGGLPTQICPLEAAHRESMAAICWVHSKSNTEFYTGSSDGSIKYWDGRDLETPVHELLLDPSGTDEQRRENAHGVAVLEFEYTIPVRYIIGSDMGHIFIGNRKGLLPTETLLANYKLFAGPIRTIERNPFFVKNFLIVGDWCAKIWAEENKNAPVTFQVKKKNQMYCGTWSPTRCSLFVTGDAMGEVDFWDLLLDHREPIFTLKFQHAVTHLQFRPDGEYLAIALQNGDCHMMELDEATKRSVSKDKALIMALFEREQLRCKLLEGRVEEIKLRQKNTALEVEQQTGKGKAPDVPNVDPENPDQFLQLIEEDEEFKNVINNFKEFIYKVEMKRMDRPVIMERTEFEQDFVPEPSLDTLGQEAAVEIDEKAAADALGKGKPKKKK